MSVERPAPAASFEEGLAWLSTFSTFAVTTADRYRSELEAQWERDRFDRAWDLELIDGTNEDVATRLRRVRHIGLFRVLWRDVHGLANTVEVLDEISALAEALTGRALHAAELTLQRFGAPRDRAGSVVRPVVYGLGKLGGRELNFSSDVDLVYAFTVSGETDGRRRLSNEEYFTRLGRQLTALLGDFTEHGQCYRVDLRLRPFGKAGRMALSFDAMDQYFQREGRDWERYAWLKARPVAGDVVAGEAWLRSLRPFIYRRYLDFSAYDALRRMKAMIRAEVERKGLTDNIKLGRGGIREIEFIAQAFQLIRGGREATLRTRSVLNALHVIGELGLLPVAKTVQLREAYLFLRTLENRYQQVDDAQTHVPPPDPDIRDAIAASLGLARWDALAEREQATRDFVAAAFDALFAERGEAPSRPWQAGSHAERFEALLGSAEIRSLGARGRDQLESLLRRLQLMELDPVALEAVLEVIVRISGRTTYLALLCEHAEVLEHLVRLCVGSPWLKDQLAAHPLLLDDLIDRRRPEDEESAVTLLDGRLASAEGDLEREMDALREVLISRRFQVARAWLDGELDPVRCGELLTDIADAILIQVGRLARRDIEQRHGAFAGVNPELAIIAYGTLGARELSFASDLDLVFLYDGVDEEAVSDGPRALAPSVYFTRLVQRILHYLTTVTNLGRLYEVDTRLRPNGRSGLLVSRVDAFFLYQNEKAWTWELQALTRARAVTGNAAFRVRFEAERRAVIQAPRDAAGLARDVVEMREKMRAELGDGAPYKQGRGGMVDLDFLLQYARLRWGSRHPDLVGTRTTPETIAAMQNAAILTPGQAKQLEDAYRALRRHGLDLPLRDVDRTSFPSGAIIIELWDVWLGDPEGESRNLH